MLSVNDFVDVNIKIKKSIGLIGSYDTMVYLAPTASTETNGFYDATSYTGSNTDIKKYFANGGQYLILCKDALSGSTDQAKLEALISSFSNLRDYTSSDANAKYSYDKHKFIYICLAYARNSDMTTLLNGAETLKAPKKVRIIITQTTTNLSTNLSTLTASNCAVVQLTNTSTTEGVLIGAYTTQIDLSRANTVRDYCFYKFNALSDSDVVGINGLSDITVNEKTIANSIENIAGNIINVGGNLTNGISLHIDFATVCLENDCVYVLWEALRQRQTLTQSGLNVCTTMINSIMGRYIDNGFIQPNSTYTGANLTTIYNGKTYKVINTGTLLSTGYLIYSVPMANISTSDKAHRKFTPIIVVVVTQDGARMITLDGNVYA